MKAIENGINTGKRKLLLRVLVLCIVISSLVVCFVPMTSANVTGSDSPSLSIDYYNLSYSDYTYVYYAVSCKGITPSTVRMLLWYEPQENGFVKGTEACETQFRSMTTINGESYAVFRSEGIAPKLLTRIIYSRAYAVTSSGIVYSEPVKYSPVKYLNDLIKRPASTEEDVELAEALCAYGAAAQRKFNYNTETLASEPFFNLILENALLDDGFSYGTYKQGTELTLHASDNVAGDVVWFDDEGNMLGGGRDLTLVLNDDITVRPMTAASPADLGAYEGKTFSAGEKLLVPCFFPHGELTVEAAINIPRSYSGRGGVLFGSYGTEDDVINIEIYTGGKVRLYFGFEDGTSSSLLFDTDVRGNGARHIAVTIPENGGYCRLYVDGALVEEKKMPCDIPVVVDRMMLGGDYRAGNSQYFKGRLYSFAVFRGIRSDEEIYFDTANGADLTSSKLLAAYRFVHASDRSDLSPNAKDLTTVEKTGMSFESVSDRYSLTDTFDSVPLTYEAIIDCDADVSNQKGCTIIGNYNDMYVPGVTFRVYLNGRPSLCLRYTYEHQDQFTIPVNILGAGKVHVAFSIDDEYVYGYLNGKLELKKAHCGYLPELVPYPFSVGGDNRTDNTWWFRNGSIYSIALYGEYRDAEQIAADINRADTDDPSLMLAFDFTKSDEDQSQNHNVLVPYFYDDDFVDPDTYDYTFACIGDTQSLVKYYPEEVHNIYDFILDNADEMKIERVIGLGDMTDDNTHEQWQVVSEEIFRLDGKIPYTVIRGNHDHYARTPEAEATKELMFGYYFDNETYRAQYDGSYDGTPANTYKRFTAGGVPYLLLCLDYGPDDDVLAWASSVVEQYPNDNVIVVTHAFLFHDATTIDENDSCPPKSEMGSNNCDEMWDKFVSKHENIVLVLCGHDPSNEVVVSRMTGDSGNTVTCLLINPQHTDYYDRPSGLVALLHFSDGGRTITVDNYSTVQGKFYKTCNKITVDNIDLVSAP